MINRVINLIFIDFFAVVINFTLGTLLRSKICNYSWEGVYQTENPSANQSDSTEMLEEEGDTTM